MWLSRILGLSWSFPFPYAQGISKGNYVREEFVLQLCEGWG